MKEFGLFNDEGLVEGDFSSREEAETALRERYSSDDQLVIAEVCSDHPDQPKDYCEECEEE